MYNYVWPGGVSHDLPVGFIDRTKEFLDYFSLQHIRELPELPELPDLKSLDYELPLEEPEREENSKQDSQPNLTQ